MRRTVYARIFCGRMSARVNVWICLPAPYLVNTQSRIVSIADPKLLATSWNNSPVRGAIPMPWLMRLWSTYHLYPSFLKPLLECKCVPEQGPLILPRARCNQPANSESGILDLERWELEPWSMSYRLVFGEKICLNTYQSPCNRNSTFWDFTHQILRDSTLSKKGSGWSGIWWRCPS